MLAIVQAKGQATEHDIQPKHKRAKLLGKTKSSALFTNTNTLGP
jgi:hypothetical protein